MYENYVTLRFVKTTYSMAKKDRSVLESRTRKAYKMVFLVLILIALLSFIGVLVLNWISKEHSLFSLDNWHDLLNNILGAAIGAALVDLYLDFRTKDEKEDEIQKGIVEALCPPDAGTNPPLVSKLFNQQEFEGFLKNGLSAYAKSNALGDAALSYFRENCNLVRRSEVYNIEISPETIHQSYRHTGVFCLPKGVRPELRIFFIFANTKVQRGELDKYLSDSTYAFREEFDDPEFEDNIAQIAQEVENADKKVRSEKMQALFEAMGLEMIIYQNEQQDEEDGYRINYEDIQIKLCKNSRGKAFGIHIAGTVPEEYIFEEKSGPSEYHQGSGFIHFISQVEVSYPAKKGHSLFPIVYSRIAVNPSFTISFKGFAEPDVKFFPFLSFNTAAAPNHNDGLVRKTDNVYHFTTTRTIFPRSGVVFSWINPENV